MMGAQELYLRVRVYDSDGDRCPSTCPLLVHMSATEAKCSGSFGSRHNEFRNVYWGNILYRSDYRSVAGEMKTGFLRSHKCPLKTLEDLGVKVEEEMDI